MIPIYHLEIEAKYCKVNGLVNRFPIYSLDGTHPVSFSKPINSVLVKTANALELIITPAEMTGSSIKPFGIRGSIKKYAADDVTGPDKGKVVKEFSFEKQVAGAVTFDNEEFDFRKLLTEGRKIEDSKVLKAYGSKLQQLFVEKKIDAILEEFKVKFTDYALCYGVEADDIADQFAIFLDNKYYPNSPRLDFKPEELIFKPWCDKRVWEICVGTVNDEFLLTTPSNGVEYSTSVFVALIDGEPKVVR